MAQLWRSFGGVVPLFLIVSLIIIILAFLFRGRSTGPKQVWLNILFTLSIVGILLVTLFPRHYGVPVPRIINLIPFVGMYKIMFHSVDITVPIRNLGFNILLFVPFGFFLSWRKELKNHLLLAVTLKGLCLSLFVEIFQYIVPMRRSADVDDLILNTIGAFVGYMIWKMCYKLAPNTFILSTKLEKEKRDISSLDR